MFLAIPFIWIVELLWIASSFAEADILQNDTNNDAFKSLVTAGIGTDNEDCDMELMVQTVQTIVLLMQWKNIVIFHDGTQDVIVHGILDSLWNHNVYTCILDLRVDGGAATPAYCPNLESKVNVVIVCNDDNLHKPTTIFSKNEDKSKFLLIVSLNIASASPGFLFEDSMVDNIALLRPYRPIMEDNVCFNSFELSSLMYVNRGCRLFERRMIVTKQNFILSRNLVYPNLEFGLNQKKLIISALETQPFCILHKINGTVRMSGLYGDILKQLVTELNFTYEIVVPEDGEWGRIDDKGSWTGLIKQLKNEDVDMVFAPLAISIDRSRVIDYGTTVYYDRSSLLMRSDAGGFRWGTVLKPFQIQTFIVLLAIFMGSSFCLFIVEKCSMLHNDRRQSMMPTFGECLWYFFGASFAQGGSYETKSHSGAVFISSFWMYSVIILVFYSGSLMSQLTVKKEEQMVDTIKDLARQTKYTYGTLGGSYYSMKLKNSSLPIYNVLYNNIMEFYESDPDVLSKDTEVHYRKIKSENYIFILDKVYMDMKAATDCDLYVSSESFDFVQVAPGFPKRSPIKDIISEKILSYHDNGLIDLWAKKSMPDNECEGFQKVQAKSLSMDDFISAFVALLIGFVAASIVFVIEKCCKCCDKIDKNETMNL